MVANRGGPPTHFNSEDERARRILKDAGISGPVSAFHGFVEGTADFHPQNFGLMPFTHSHTIRDSLPLISKERIAAHLDKYHARKQ